MVLPGAEANGGILVELRWAEVLLSVEEFPVDFCLEISMLSEIFQIRRRGVRRISRKSIYIRVNRAV